MAASLADLSIHTVNLCAHGALRLPDAREMLRTWIAHAFPFECALVFLSQKDGIIVDDPAEIIFDPWLHGGIVYYGDTTLYASGRDPETVAYAWLPRAQARGF